MLYTKIDFSEYMITYNVLLYFIYMHNTHAVFLIIINYNTFVH